MPVLIISQLCLCQNCYLASNVHVNNVFSQYSTVYLVSSVYGSTIIYSILFKSILLFSQFCYVVSTVYVSTGI